MKLHWNFTTFESKLFEIPGHSTKTELPKTLKNSTELKVGLPVASLILFSENHPETA